MIIGSGMLARVFGEADLDPSEVLIFASGVSNSQCEDRREFERERNLLSQWLSDSMTLKCFVYFSTCSVNDQESLRTPYVQHKLQMEQLVRAYRGHLILRLPQVAGRTPNPHTLLNYLYARIARGERFSLWLRARRNVIDCDDVRTLGVALINNGVHGDTIAIANTRDYAMIEIVETLERVCRGHAVYDAVDRGGACDIDVSRILPLLRDSGIVFGDDYLQRVLGKYYG